MKPDLLQVWRPCGHGQDRSPRLAAPSNLFYLAKRERERVRVCLSHPNERPFSTPTKLARIPWPFQASFQITKQGECQNLSSKTKPSYRYFLQLPTTSPSYWGTILINEEISLLCWVHDMYFPSTRILVI